MGGVKVANIDYPLVKRIPYSEEAIKAFETEYQKPLDVSDELTEADIFLAYPTVYIITDRKRKQVSAYVGETSNIISRTVQHIKQDPLERDDWDSLAQSSEAEMYIVGHDKFNKSLTLDVENQLMLYLSGNPKIQQLNNRRSNPQFRYYTSELMPKITSQVWRELHSQNPDIFPEEEVIKDSALFKASPFHKLTAEQLKAKEILFEKIRGNLKLDKQSELILVSGEAGAGKTVLLSSLFYDLNRLRTSDFSTEEDRLLNCYLLVNHDEQHRVYDDIALKLRVQDKRGQRVQKPTSFINNHLEEVDGELICQQAVDVVLVDEGHLLLTQGKQSYRGKNQLEDLLKCAKLVILIFDENQIISRAEYWEDSQIQKLIDTTTVNDNHIRLENQMRLQSSPETLQWIDDFVKRGEIKPIPEDNQGYDLKIFTDAQEMYEAIRDRAYDKEKGLSRMLATYDWDWKQGKGTDWNVTVGDFSLPWNYSQTKSPSQSSAKNLKSWAEQEASINEVGSTYTIQGFDLNYAGVIIGPSVKYRDGRVIYDGSESKSNQMTSRRTMSDGSKQDVSEKLLQNQLNILLKRGVHGLYIYAVDDALQQKLLEAQNAGQ